MKATRDLKNVVGISKACDALGVSRMTELRSRTETVPNNSTRKLHPRALTKAEEMGVLGVLASADYMDCAPAAAHAMLLEQGDYLCSVSTMYRLLRKHKAVRERRLIRRHPAYTAPQLLATQPRQVWSWDITKLLGFSKFEYFYLYVMLDIFSRRVVGWFVAEKENGTLAADFIQDCCEREQISPNMLTIHSDRGSPMMSKPVTGLLVTLDVQKSVSRPHVSNDNPYSEAHFKTMKYRPNFPKRFGSIQDVRATLKPVFEWYNKEHRPSGIAYFTPNDVHFGRAEKLQEDRRIVLKKAYYLNPQRFVRGLPQPPKLPEAAWINPPSPTTEAEVLKGELLLRPGEQEITQRTNAA